MSARNEAIKRIEAARRHLAEAQDARKLYDPIRRDTNIDLALVECDRALAALRQDNVVRYPGLDGGPCDPFDPAA